MLHTKKHGMLGELTALLALAGSVPRGVRGRPHWHGRREEEEKEKEREKWP